MLEEYIADAERIAEVVAPELSGKLFFRSFDDLADYMPRPEDTLGFCILPNQLLSDLGGRLEGHDGTQGLLVLDTEAIRSAAFGPPRLRAAATTLHELAHLLPRHPPRPAWMAEHKVAVEALMATSLRSAATREPNQAEIDSHDPQWVRRATHLWCRSQFAGLSVACEFLHGSRFEGWERHFVACLLAEAHGLKDADFATIERDEPPADFGKLLDIVNAPPTTTED